MELKPRKTLPPPAVSEDSQDNPGTKQAKVEWHNRKIGGRLCTTTTPQGPRAGLVIVVMTAMVGLEQR